MYPVCRDSSQEIQLTLLNNVLSTLAGVWGEMPARSMMKLPLTCNSAEQSSHFRDTGSLFFSPSL